MKAGACSEGVEVPFLKSAGTGILHTSTWLRSNGNRLKRGPSFVNQCDIEPEGKSGGSRLSTYAYKSVAIQSILRKSSGGVSFDLYISSGASSRASQDLAVTKNIGTPSCDMNMAVGQNNAQRALPGGCAKGQVFLTRFQATAQGGGAAPRGQARE